MKKDFYEFLSARSRLDLLNKSYTELEQKYKSFDLGKGLKLAVYNHFPRKKQNNKRWSSVNSIYSLWIYDTLVGFVELWECNDKQHLYSTNFYIEIQQLEIFDTYQTKGIEFLLINQLRLFTDIFSPLNTPIYNSDATIFQSNQLLKSIDKKGYFNFNAKDNSFYIQMAKDPNPIYS